MIHLNGRRVIFNGSVILRSSDSFRVDGPPNLSISIREDMPSASIAVSAVGDDFVINLDGFTAGTSLTSLAKGTIAGGQLIVLMTIATRISQIGDIGLYQVSYTVAERIDQL